MIAGHSRGRDTGRAMSQENAEIVRRAYAAFNVGLDEFMAYYADDVELLTDPTWPEAGLYQGKGVFRRWWEQILAVYDDHTLELDDLIPVNEQRVLSTFRWHVRGGTSGITTTLSGSVLTTHRGALICRAQFFFNHQDALEAAGLSE